MKESIHRKDERERKKQPWKCLCAYIRVYTHTQKIFYTYLFLKWLRKKRKASYIYIYIYIYTKKICRDQRSSQTMNPNRTFKDTNPWIKKNHIPIKTIFIIKARHQRLPKPLYIPWRRKSLIGLVLWHIDYCRLFKTKSCLYIYTKYIWLVNSFCW